MPLAGLEMDLTLEGAAAFADDCQAETRARDIVAVPSIVPVCRSRFAKNPLRYRNSTVWFSVFPKNFGASGWCSSSDRLEGRAAQYRAKYRI